MKNPVCHQLPPLHKATQTEARFAEYIDLRMAEMLAGRAKRLINWPSVISWGLFFGLLGLCGVVIGEIVNG